VISGRSSVRSRLVGLNRIEAQLPFCAVNVALGLEPATYGTISYRAGILDRRRLALLLLFTVKCFPLFFARSGRSIVDKDKTYFM
jgi:hypothetical protein